MAVTALYLQRKGYTARQDRQLIEDIFGLTERVLESSGLVATAVGGGSYQISVSAGKAVVKGDTNVNQGMYRVFSDSAEPLTFTAPATNPRVDLVVARVYDFAEVGSGPDQATIEIIQGTATSGANISNLTGAPGQGGGPAIPNTALPLWYVLVPTSGGVSSAGLLDARAKTSGYSEVLTEQTTTSTSIVDLTTAGPSVMINVPTNGLVMVHAEVEFKISSSSFRAIALLLEDGTDISTGGSPSNGGILMTDSTAFATHYTAPQQRTATDDEIGTNRKLDAGFLVFSATPGNHTYKMGYRVTGGTGTFRNRRLRVRAVSF